MSNTNPSSRPTTPQNAGRSRSARQRKDQPIVKDVVQAASGNVVAGPTAESSQDRSVSRQPRNKPLPTASQLRQMGSDNAVDTRPRGIINLPKQELDTPSRSKSRSARTPSVKQQDGANVVPPNTNLNRTANQPVDKKRSRPPKNAKGRPAPATNEMSTEDDVFSAGIHPPSTFGKLETPNRSSRRPRHHRTVSEPFSVLSGNAGDDSFVQHDGKALPAQGNSRRKRREKDKDKDKDKGGGGGEGGGARAGDQVLAVPLAPALGNLHIQADTDADSDPTKQPPKRTGLRFPLTEDDDGDSSISDTPDEVGVSDDSGVALDRSHRAEQSSSGFPLDILNNAGARLLHELRSLSQSAPGGKSFLTDHTQPEDGYGSGSGYGSGQGQCSGRQGREGGRRQPNNAGGRGDMQDESAVWDMPDLQERGSGTDLTVSPSGDKLIPVFALITSRFPFAAVATISSGLAGCQPPHPDTSSCTRRQTVHSLGGSRFEQEERFYQGDPRVHPLQVSNARPRNLWQRLVIGCARAIPQTANWLCDPDETHTTTAERHGTKTSPSPYNVRPTQRFRRYRTCQAFGSGGSQGVCRTDFP